MTRCLTAALALLLHSDLARGAADWIRPEGEGSKPLWGIRGGLQFGIFPGSVTGTGNGGPRGLIRLGSPVKPDGGYALVNFIAVEPVVRGRKGFSELERSRLDRVQGKRFWTGPEDPAEALSQPPHPGTLARLDGGVEELSVVVHVERFDHGAHLSVRLQMRSDRPEELRLTVLPREDSVPMEFCILTATMGNMTRARKLWLKSRVVSSTEIYADYRENQFTPHSVHPKADLHQTADGGYWAAISGDEENPAAVFPFPASRVWHYPGAPVTQYWIRPAPAGALEVAVNGRYTYWQSDRPIPGGVSFENFEMREPFAPGQTFVFGITRRPPEELVRNGPSSK